MKIEKDKIDYYILAPSVIIKEKKDSIRFEKNDGQVFEINNREKRLTLEILCKNGKVEINDITSLGKLVDIDLLNDLVNGGFLEPCLDLFP